MIRCVLQGKDDEARAQRVYEERERKRIEEEQRKKEAKRLANEELKQVLASQISEHKDVKEAERQQEIHERRRTRAEIAHFAKQEKVYLQ